MNRNQLMDAMRVANRLRDKANELHDAACIAYLNLTDSRTDSKNIFVVDNVSKVQDILSEIKPFFSGSSESSFSEFVDPIKPEYFN